MTLTGLSNIDRIASFVIENVHADLVTEINHSPAAPTFENASVTSAAPENLVSPPHESVVLDYGFDAMGHAVACGHSACTSEIESPPRLGLRFPSGVSMDPFSILRQNQE
jgi:hypothetical protein